MLAIKDERLDCVSEALYDESNAYHFVDEGFWALAGTDRTGVGHQAVQRSQETKNLRAAGWPLRAPFAFFSGRALPQS